MTLKAKDAAVPQEYQTPKGESSERSRLINIALQCPKLIFAVFPVGWALSQLQTGGCITLSAPINWVAVWVGKSRGKATLPQADSASREPHSQLWAERALLRPCEAEAPSDRRCLSLYFLPACWKAAPSAPASSLHPEQSEPCSGGGWRAKRRLSAERPLSTPRGARQLLPHRLLAHHAGYFHPDVFCHHRPGDPLLHHLHALERCWGRCGSASALQSKHHPGEPAAPRPTRL